jgi:hypothetical protein
MDCTLRIEGEGRKFLVVTGGQTRTDHAAIEFAVANQIPHGTWCPRTGCFRKGEPAPSNSGREAHTAGNILQLKLNIEKSDATLLFTGTEQSSGTQKILAKVKDLHKPILVLYGYPDRLQQDSLSLLKWLDSLTPERLHITGPREFNNPKIHDYVKTVLSEAVLPYVRSAATDLQL